MIVIADRISQVNEQRGLTMLIVIDLVVWSAAGPAS